MFEDNRKSRQKLQSTFLLSESLFGTAITVMGDPGSVGQRLKITLVQLYKEGYEAVFTSSKNVKL